MATTYELKEIEVTITLDVDGANNQYVFNGVATNVAISKPGGTEFSTAQVEIYGLSLETMSQLTWLSFQPLGRRYNLMQIAAGEQGKELSVIFQGDITVAYADLNGSSPVLRIEAQTASYPLLNPTPQVAIQGEQNVDQLLLTFASDANLTYRNEGVRASISDCVLTGSPVEKMRQIADHIGADIIFDDDKAVLVPRRKTRAAEGSIPVVSAASGMIGYPTFTNTGIQASTFFRPDLKIASAVRIESIVPRASGVWKITQLTHELSAHNPGSSAWRTTFQGMWLE